MADRFPPDQTPAEPLPGDRSDHPDALARQAQLLALRQHKDALRTRLMAKIRAARVWEARRLEAHRTGRRPRVLFICHRPSLWGSLATVFEALLAGDACEVMILCIPNKKQLPRLGLRHEIYHDEGAFDFFREFPCRVLNGFDPHRETWLDIRALEPDYVFFQTPYNFCRPAAYHSEAVSAYAILGYVHYGILIFKGGVAANVYPQSFLKDLAFIYCETPWHKRHLEERQAAMPEFDRAKLVLTGYPRFDTLYRTETRDGGAWPQPRQPGRFRVLWTPRWNISERNAHFLEYKDRFLDLCDADPTVDLVCRPHPQTFLECVAMGHMTEEDVQAHERAYALRTNAVLDRSGRYQETFLSSDVLVSDISSILPEYLMTGKPIIYCHRTDWFNELGARIAEGFYWARSWEEVTALIRQLREGADPLREVRLRLARELFPVPEEGAGAAIARHILEHWQSGS